MRRLTVFFFLTIAVMVLKAQMRNYWNYDALSITALLEYVPDEKGIYHEQRDVDAISRTLEAEPYAYNTKTHRLYIRTQRGNFVIQYEKSKDKVYKKDHLVPKLKDEELNEKVMGVSAGLQKYYREYNELRTKFIADSIAQVREDSVKAVRKREREDSLRREEHRRQVEAYLAGSDIHFIRDYDDSLKCIYCDDETPLSQSYITGLTDSHIAWLEPENDSSYPTQYPFRHVGEIPNKLRDLQSFKLHEEVYGDSLRFSLSDFSEEKHNEILDKKLRELEKKINRYYPDGMFEEFWWNDEYDMLTFGFRYFNTSYKTIKYIKVEVAILNDVGDVRNTYTFRGTGPLESFKTSTWDWDEPVAFLSGDVTTLDIKRVTITYMNGSTKVLTGDKIKYHPSYYEDD